jgi:hypothetical protein
VETLRTTSRTPNSHLKVGVLQVPALLHPHFKTSHACRHFWGKCKLLSRRLVQYLKYAFKNQASIAQKHSRLSSLKHYQLQFASDCIHNFPCLWYLEYNNNNNPSHKNIQVQLVAWRNNFPCFMHWYPVSCKYKFARTLDTSHRSTLTLISEVCWREIQEEILWSDWWDIW